MGKARNERRQALKRLGKTVLHDPATKRMLRNRRSRDDGATEVYIVDPLDGSGRRFFDVCAMRKWCKSNLEPLAAPIDMGRVERLLESGAVDAEHIRNHTIIREPEPIIICRDGAGPGEDQIVDGSHRFVAFAMAAALANRLDMLVPAYLLMPDQWRQFLVPAHVAEAFAFDADLKGASS